MAVLSVAMLGPVKEVGMEAVEMEAVEATEAMEATVVAVMVEVSVEVGLVRRATETDNTCRSAAW